MIEWVRARWQWVQQTRPWRSISHLTDVGGSILAAGMSYQSLFAVFAALWVGFGVFGIFLETRPELLASLVDQINAFIPGLIGSDGFVKTSALLTARTLNITSAIAAISLVWVMVNWFTSTRRSIRIIFGLDVKQYRSFVLLKLRDFTLAIVFGLALLVSAALVVLSSNLADLVFGWLDWNPKSWLLSTMGQLVRYAAIYVFDVIVLVAMHKLLAEVKVPWRRLLAGSAVGGVALLGLKVLGTELLGGATSNPLLASFAVLIGILLWLNLICRVLLLTAAWIATGLDRALGLSSQSDAVIEIV